MHIYSACTARESGGMLIWKLEQIWDIYSNLTLYKNEYFLIEIKMSTFTKMLICSNNVKSPFFVSSSCCFGIASAQSLYLRIVKCNLVYVFTRAHRRFIGHYLTNEFLLVLEHLIQIRIKSLICRISVNIDFAVCVSLTNDTSVTLFHIRGTFHTEHFKKTNRTSRNILKKQ